MQDNQTQPDTTFTLNHLSFRVPGRTLLHPLSLTFPAGKVTGLIGHNGSGKSTLLKMLGRHQPPSEGDILLDDQPLESWSSKAFARKVAYLPQQLPQAEGMTVRELVAIGRYPWHGALGRFSHEDRVRVEEAIAQGVDVFLSGEISEQTVHLARETGVAYIAAGHHVTERPGVRALAAHLAERFGLACEFVEIDNPV